MRMGALALLLAGFLVAGCGGSDSSEKAPPPARAQDFPTARGQTLRQLLMKLPAGPVLAPSGLELRTGRERFGFALFRRDRSQITNASAALYVAPVGGGPAKGPYLSRYEDLSVRPQFQSRQTATDPNAAKSIYTPKIPLDKPGRYESLGRAPRGKKVGAVTLPSAGVVVKKVADDPIPAVGTAPP